MKKVVLMIIAVLMMSAVVNADTTDRRPKRKKHKTHRSHHTWKAVSIGRTCNK
jgi:Ni/Co efflux regulator RcnB